MVIAVRFACGHVQKVSETNDAAPICAVCGEHRVSSVTAPPPRITGQCSSPLKVRDA